MSSELLHKTGFPLWSPQAALAGLEFTVQNQRTSNSCLCPWDTGIAGMDHLTRPNVFILKPWQGVRSIMKKKKKGLFEFLILIPRSIPVLFCNSISFTNYNNLGFVCLFCLFLWKYWGKQRNRSLFTHSFRPLLPGFWPSTWQDQSTW